MCGYDADVMRKAGILALLLLSATAADAAQARAVPAPPVRIAIAPLGLSQVLQSGTFPVALRARRTVRVRVVATLVSETQSWRLMARRTTLPRGRLRRVALALPPAARSALENCAPSRLEVSVKAGSRARRTTQPIALGPPLCARFFARDSVWNSPLAPDAALDPASGQVIGALIDEVRREYDSGPQPTVNTTQYSVPIYTVPAGQRAVSVALDAQDQSLARSFAAVPLPPSAHPATGTDASLVVWQPERDALWEFWHLRRTASGWAAGWGGRIDGASGSPGYYGGAHPSWGGSASSLSIAGGLVLADELRAGVIPHALAMGVPHPRAGVYASPAQRTDGDSSSLAALPEGARLRLDPALDLNALNLPAPVLAVARAAQKYGILVRDASGVVAFYAEDPAPLGADPYPQLFGGVPARVLLRQFPWDHLQLMKMDLRGQSSGQPSPLGCGSPLCG